MPTPIFAPLLSPGEELEDDAMVAVGVGIELEAVCGRLVEVVGRGEEGAESVDENVDVDVDDDDDDDDDDEVAGARFVCPEARSTAENGNG